MAADKGRRRLWVIVLVAYLILLLYFLFFAENFGRTGECSSYRYNLRPFREIIRFVRYRSTVGNEAFFLNIFGNILGFLPLGFLLPRLWEKRMNGFVTVLSCFTFSLCVELAQLITKLGCCDVDDLLLNTCGGLLGYWIYRIVRMFLNRSQRETVAKK